MTTVKPKLFQAIPQRKAGSVAEKPPQDTPGTSLAAGPVPGQFAGAFAINNKPVPRGIQANTPTSTQTTPSTTSFVPTKITSCDAVDYNKIRNTVDPTSPQMQQIQKDLAAASCIPPQ